MPAWCTFREAAQQEELRGIADALQPARAAGDLRYHVNIAAENQEDRENISAVHRAMKELMRIPTVVAGAIMPDACPTGSRGEMPVGGVVATKEAIHPGFHSSDICCSMAMSVFSGDFAPSRLLDAGMKISHFGPGGRPYSHDLQPSDDLLGQFESNRLLGTMIDAAKRQFATQGDGNHFFYVGRVRSTGQVALVTHHGSRKPGAMLYRLGMDIAEDWRRKLAPETPKHAAWIPSETDEGREYWAALQIIRSWTKKNHFAIHEGVAKLLGLKVADRFWNEHNFVFRKPDGLFYHAKGATPAFPYWAADAADYTLIPLNMAEPILIARGLNADNGLGFAPHGAGRNFSRTAYIRQHDGRNEADVMAEQTRDIDARFFCGIPDISELPGAYKNADSLRRQIDDYGLARIVDTIEPIGCIMAGDHQRGAPSKRKRR